MRVGVLTISDRSSLGVRPDATGPAIIAVLEAQGWEVLKYEIIADDLDAIRATLSSWADVDVADVILTTGGTGFSPRDVTPEATQQVIERPTPGIPEAMRQASLSITRHAMLSRATAGIRKHTLIINLPGSPKAALENLNTIMPVLQHAVELIRGVSGAESGHGKGDL